MVYLIDFENVSSNGLVGVEKLPETDSVIIFYSEKSASISMKMHRNLELAKVQKEYVLVKQNSKNALDFQISTYLGALINEFPDERFAIISKDKGYNAVVEFWESHKKTIFTYTSVDKPQINDWNNQIDCKLFNHEDKKSRVIEIIENHTTKQEINNALVKEYTSGVAGEIYKVIKPLLKEKN